MDPLLVSGLSSSSSANASDVYLSAGEGGRVSIRDVSSGVITRQGVHAEVVKRARRSVLLAEHRRSASWNCGGVRKAFKVRLACTGPCWSDRVLLENGLLSRLLGS